MEKIGNSQAELTIFYAMKLTGFNPKNIDRDSLNLIIGSIRRGFPRITLHDVREAFEWGVDGKLDVNLQTYQNFNTLYVSNVIQAWKRKKIAERRQPKLLQLGNPNPTSAEELEKAYYYVQLIFFEESERNGRKESFPDLIICDWKRAYKFMVQEGMLRELEGQELTDRVKEVAAILRAEEPDRKKRLSDAFNKQILNENDKSMTFYRMEVMDYFIKGLYK